MAHGLAHGPHAPPSIARALPCLAASLLLATACIGSAPRPGAREAPRDPAVATDRDFRDVAARQVEELFMGRFPGVDVYRTPGGMAVRVRGAASFYGSTRPLYVVDGLPIQVGPEGLVGLNPRDVARIQVLKDPADLAQYGIQGANGVVRITTHRAP